jgi:hypothetical protein
MRLLDGELIATHQGLLKMDISFPDLNSTLEKVETELKLRGYKVEFLQAPKSPSKRKKQYEYRYSKEGVYSARY